VSVDPARVARALHLDVEPLGPGAYRVSGGREPHVVRGTDCDCADARFHRGPCKHRIAIHVATLHPAVRSALRKITTTERGAS
jgi:hypothetical protein